MAILCNLLGTMALEESHRIRRRALRYDGTSHCGHAFDSSEAILPQPSSNLIHSDCRFKDYYPEGGPSPKISELRGARVLFCGWHQILQKIGCFLSGERGEQSLRHGGNRGGMRFRSLGGRQMTHQEILALKQHAG